MIKCIKGPCQDCEKRAALCHSSCPDYISYKEELAKIHKNIREHNVYPAYVKTLMDKIYHDRSRGTKGSRG